MIELPVNATRWGIGLFFLLNYGLTFGQPYFDTHVTNNLVAENSFIHQPADTRIPPEFLAIKDQLPQPVWQNRPDVIQCYWRTWELAFGNLHPAHPAVGFVSPFIDPAFNGHIFMWDSGFMLMFGKYGNKVFPFQSTLDNFYAKQHADGFICREIRESDGTDVFERFDPSSTGPNILPWTEWEYFLNFNDTARLRKVFIPLLAYYQWFHTYRTWNDGTYFSSGWGCGMDNQPRLPKGFNPEWSHGHMSWIDITLQQILAGNILIEMAEKLNCTNDLTAIKDEVAFLTKYVNTVMWDEKTCFYYDKFQSGSLSEIKSIASFWALLAGMVPDSSVKSFVSHLENPNEFDRLHRVPTLSADHPDYNPEGGYWRGSIWAPTNYMVLRGLSKYGYDSLAYVIAKNHLDNVVTVFNQTQTLHENYAPDRVQGNNAKDFVGWTGLVPISVLFEYVFGLRPNVPSNTLTWDIHLTDEFGIKKYPFGKDGLMDLVCRQRKDKTQKPLLTIVTNVPFQLQLTWEGGTKEIQVIPGITKY